MAGINWKEIKIHPERTFSVKEDGFYGSYFPSHENQFPGKAMIVCSGADGSYKAVQYIAEMFAREGMSAIALAYFHAEGTPREDLLSPVEYVQKAAQWLNKKGMHAGMWGISLGGEYALLCGSLFPEIECVIAVSPVHIVTQCGNVFGGFHFVNGSPFSFHHEPVPYISVPEIKAKAYTRRVRKELFLKKEFYMKFYYEDLLKSPHDLAADIKVENIKGPVLLISGKEDTCVPADWVCEQVVQRRADYHCTFPTIHHSYSPLSHYATPARPLSAGIFLVERRYPEECNESRTKSWEDTISFLKENWK